jgi:hypothetical protein
MEREIAVAIKRELQEAIRHIDASIDFARQIAEPQRDAMMRQIANAIASVSWDLLECHVYSAYPDLRPYELDRDKKRS